MSDKPTLRIDYDDDLMDVMDHVNKALAKTGFKFVDDGEIHDGWMLYTLTKVEEVNEDPV